LRTVLSDMYKELITGSTLSETLVNHKESFPEMFVSMVQAGEISGNIERVMCRLATHYEKEWKIQSKVKSAMVYPAVLSIVATAVVIFLLTNVMPTFVDLYSSSGVPLPFVTLMMLNMSQWIKNMWYVIVLVVLLFIVSFSKLSKCEKIRYMIDSYKLRIPLFRTLKIKLVASRFTRTLSTLVGSGVPLLEGLDSVAMVAGNEYIKRIILNAREDVRKGSSLSYSIKNQNLFPQMVHYMIKIGEESGEIEEVLDKTADFYDEEAENTIQKLVVMIEPMMIVIMAAIIGFIMLAMVTPMFDMVNTVQ
ncbi:MAG: type II secretion system F family protein, partial [Sedimentibacter sp.]